MTSKYALLLLSLGLTSAINLEPLIELKDKLAQRTKRGAYAAQSFVAAEPAGYGAEGFGIGVATEPAGYGVQGDASGYGQSQYGYTQSVDYDTNPYDPRLPDPPCTWTAWSLCDAPCNGGSAWRKRRITDECGYGPDSQLKTCNTQPCSNYNFNVAPPEFVAPEPIRSRISSSVSYDSSSKYSQSAPVNSFQPPRPPRPSQDAGNPSTYGASAPIEENIPTFFADRPPRPPKPDSFNGQQQGPSNYESFPSASDGSSNFGPSTDNSNYRSSIPEASPPRSNYRGEVEQDPAPVPKANYRNRFIVADPFAKSAQSNPSAQQTSYGR